LEDDMQFGESLARLASDIVAMDGARMEAAGARGAALSALRAATRNTLANNTARRVAVSRDLSAGAAALRQRLAASDAALDTGVRRSLAAMRQDQAAKRRAIADNAKALRVDLELSRRDAAVSVAASRAETRADQAAAAQALAGSLGQFVAGLRSETAVLQRAVVDQLVVARGAWGKSAMATPAAMTEPAAKHEPTAMSEPPKDEGGHAAAPSFDAMG
jgi:hypothetical protein